MSPDSRRDKSKNNRRTAKAIDAMPIAGIVVAALLVLPGLTIVGSSSYNSALAQPYTPGGGGTPTTGGGGNATTGGGGSQPEVMMHLDEVRKALQNNDVQGATMHLDLAMNLLRGGSSSSSTQGNTTSKAPLS